MEEKGTTSFFNREDNRDQCHKLTEDKMTKAQYLLSSSLSQKQTAKQKGLSEGAIRYHIRGGALKKVATLPLYQG